MELRVKKEKTLFWMFLKQVILLSTEMFLEIAIFVCAFTVGINKGIILPADYAENTIRKNESVIASSDSFDPNLIPNNCDYGIFTFDDQYLEGNLSKQGIHTAIDVLHDQSMYGGNYYVIAMKSGYCVIKYEITPHFANAQLNSIIPHLEITVILLFILIFVAIVVINSISFCKRLKKKLHPLYDEIHQIKDKNLISSQKGSDIKEINDILLALDDMKEALASSLKKEWETEQRRIHNVSALAHDIKTPLTIIKGNTELLKEETESEDINEQLEVVNTNVDKIERYIELLIQETKRSEHNSTNEKEVSLQEIADSIEVQSKELCDAKQMPLLIEKSVQNRNVRLDEQSLQRAVMNLVVNATEYTNPLQGIKIRISAFDKEFIIQIEDYGNGFSKAALQHAKEQFFTERMERSDEHYGLGMYSASNLAKSYGGTLEYKNKENKNGAVVLFKIFPN